MLVSLTSVMPVWACSDAWCLRVFGMQPMATMSVPCCRQAWLMPVAFSTAMPVWCLSVQLLLTTRLSLCSEKLCSCCTTMNMAWTDLVAMLAGRRMLQADSDHNISATFAYDTTPTVAASFPGTFTADRYTYELQQQGESETVYLRPEGAAARLLTFLAGTNADSTQLSHADIRQQRAQHQT